MANIQPTVSLDIQKELKNLDLIKYHPNAIVNIGLNRVQDMLAGKVTISDPSNPFAYLIESSGLNTAFAIQEFALLSRKRYQRLANTDEDLYLHMSDYDFLGRFSEPSFANVTFNILFSDFKTKAVYDSANKEYIMKIPRHLKVMINDYCYLLTSAIIIRLTSAGIVDVRFENQDFNNIFPITTNYIDFTIRNINQDEKYLQFSLKLPEVDVLPIDVPADRTNVFRGEIEFSSKRQFYFFRAFFQKNGVWQEMLVTHTNDVYDIHTPTCIIKVLPTSSKVQYHIPTVYFGADLVGPNIRFLTYTTMGQISVNFGDFRIEDFTVEYAGVFPEEEMDLYTQPIQAITKAIYTTDVVESGKNGMDFETLKDAIINNSIGDRKLPITPKQLEYSNRQKNFKIIKDVDVVTNRVYKLETEIPTPATRYPITKFNLDILEYQTKISTLRQGNSITTYSDTITVIPEGTMFRLDDGVLTHISQQEADQIKALSGSALVGAVNATNYLSVYYHYVLDTSGDRTRLRPYDLTTPKLEMISFKEFNPTTRIGLNSTQGNLYKSPNGYTLDILGNYKKYTETINVSNVTPYLVFQDAAGSTFYLEGYHYTNIGDQPVFRFLIDTTYYIDVNNNVRIANFKDANGDSVAINIGLMSKLTLIYVSSVIPGGFLSTNMDNYIINSFLVGNKCVVSEEELTVRFGYYLERLFAGVHTSTGLFEYETYDEDVLLRYKKTVYDENNAIIHEVGDLVLDDDNNTVIEHPKGSVKVGLNGLPTPINELELVRYINLLFTDYRVFLPTSSAVKDYNRQIKNHITEVTIEDAVTVQKQLLDNSEAFVVVPKTVGFVKVKTANSLQVVSSMQEFMVDVFVSYVVYNDAQTRDDIIYQIVKGIDQYLYSNTVIKKTELLNTLYKLLKESVISLSLTNFTELNEEYMQLIDANSRLSLGKSLNIETDGYSLTEAVTVNFRLIED